MTNLVKFCRKFGQKTRLFWENLLLKNTKKGQNFWIFLQNPVSGPHKRHDGGWNSLSIQQKISNLVEILVNICQIWLNFVKFTRNLVKILIFFLQNPVSGPLKRHDGGWNCLIIQKKLSNLVKFTRKVLKKSQFLIIFLQNPVSGPHWCHDGGQEFLIFPQKMPSCGQNRY